MKTLAECRWENHAHHMSGVRLARTSNSDFVVHWITKTGSTVHGSYFKDLPSAWTAYYERCRMGCLEL